MLPSIKIESLADIAQANAPFTFGQVFAPGDFAASDGLKDLQVDVKATHADGSVRHAIISGILPALGARETITLQLVKSSGSKPAQVFAGASALFTAKIAGVEYTAAIDPMTKHSAEWLAGPVVNERHHVVPLAAAGVPHPHLVARFAVRDYGLGAQRVDMTIENAWAYEPGPQNFTYDAKLVLAGKVVYEKAGLVHYHHARWRKVFWTNATPQINVKLDTKYLIASKAVPNYDQAPGVAESVLSSLAISVEPMGIGLATPYMPMTGAHNDIGLLPLWSAAYVLTMDSRARDGTLATGDGAGSFPVHYRDRVTDRPVSLVSRPRMTILGKSSDAGADAFPWVDSNAQPVPYTADTSHQPSLAYLPYLLTGDYFYLEELQFWAMWNVFNDNPNYRGFEKGLLQPGQVRGQAWSLRTLAQATYITPDADPLKVDLTGFMRNNLEWYNATYTNNAAANKLGAIVNGAAYSYNGDTAIAPWQDDFFTQSVGHAVDLGFENAKPLLVWKAKFPVGRMTAPGVCWITGAAYNMTLRDSKTSPVYDTFAQSFAHDLGVDFMKLPCAGPEMAAAWGKVTKLATKTGDMGQLSEYVMGYPSNMQPALAYAVDSGAPDSKAAWDLFVGRSVQPDYSAGPHFNILPRTYVSSVKQMIPPPPPAPMSAPTAVGTWKVLGGENAEVTVPADTILRYGARDKYLYAKASGRITINNDFFGSDPIGGVAKTADAFVPAVAAPPVVAPAPAAKPGAITAPTSTKLAKFTGLTVAITDPVTRKDVLVAAGVAATVKGAFTITNAALAPKKTYAYYVYDKTGAFVLTNSITAK